MNNNKMKDIVYDVDYRGEYRQFWLPKRQPTVADAIAKSQRKIITQAVDFTTDPVLILPAQENSYFLLQNLDVAADVWIGIGSQPSVTAKRGILIPALQAFEPYMIPQNDIWIMGSAAGKATLLYSLD